MTCNLASCGFDSDLSDLPNYDYSTSDCYDLNVDAGYIDKYTSQDALCVLTSDICKSKCSGWHSNELSAWRVGLCGYCAEHCER